MYRHLKGQNTKIRANRPIHVCLYEKFRVGLNIDFNTLDYSRCVDGLHGRPVLHVAGSQLLSAYYFILAV